MKSLLTCLIALFVTINFSYAQISITAGGTPVVVDFQDWAGAGFANPAAAGQLSSTDWDLGGFSDAYVYGGTNAGGDYARGVTPGGIFSGGLYALSYGVADTGLWTQPTGGDFTPGSLTMVLVNNTGSDITSFSIAYDLLVLNDQPRANSFNFSYSTDNVSYFPVSALDYTSPEAADLTPAVTTVPMATSVSPVTVVNGGMLYLRWSGTDVSGGGSRDEFGLDNINVVATTGTANPSVSFNVLDSEVTEDTGSFMIEVTIDVASPNPTSVDLAIDGASTAGFGSDFTGSPTTITFPAMTTASQFITISIIDDNVAESIEQAILNLTNPTNSANILFGTHTIDILDDDNILLDFVMSSASVSETGGSITAMVSIVNP
ncbi:MAG: hypothetical protein HKN92_10430, partial [Chitinophagales bacterium]|nr:hypothetical protein [Chitinophagales bacterium]